MSGTAQAQTMANPFPKSVSEATFQEAVIRVAHSRGWRVAHFRPAQNSRGRWRTPVAADGVGFPDCTFARDGKVFFRELKSNTGKLSVEQKAWGAAMGESWGVWRPDDWPTILATLR